jgi:elongation factor P
MEVVYAEPAVKGNTATNATKVVKVESGAEIKVPLFIEQGEKIIINPETKEYKGRAN